MPARPRSVSHIFPARQGTGHDVFSILVPGKVGDSPNHASFAQDVPAMFAVHCIAFRYTNFIDMQKRTQHVE